jgi:uncharacterized protein (DUF2062 family)
MNVAAWFRAKGRELIGLKDTPHAIATGVAVGMFFGFTPLWGLKTLLTLGVTRLLRGSLLASVIGVTLHDLVLPFMPVLLRWQYDIGYWIVNHPHEFPPALHLHRYGAATWLNWATFFHTGLPLLIGSVILSAPLAIISYYVTLAVVQHKRGKVELPPIS